MTVRSKWGWHPCDYETFLQLRELHRDYWAALRRFAEWQRWARKHPQNRVIRRRLRDASGRKIGTEVIGPRPEPELDAFFCVRQPVLHVRQEGGQVQRQETSLVSFLDHGIPLAYRLARRPMPDPEQVPPLPMDPAQVRALLEALNRK